MLTSTTTTAASRARHPPGSLFGLGDTPVSCVSSDSNPAGGLTVHVVDTTKPDVTAPANVTVDTGDPGGRSVSYGSATASDAVSGSPTPSCTPSSGSHFDVGTTPVTCTATDSSGNTGSAVFSVTVNLVDATPPTITVPGDIVAEATGSSGASVGFSATANDNVDPPKAASCSPGSGTTFGIATTTVTCNATDAAGNAADPKSFTVTVRDTTGPTINTPANINMAATGLGGATVNYGPVTATDAVDGSINASCSPPPGTTFGVGIATVSCNAQDSHGNRASTTSFTVTISDNVRPAVSVPGNVTAEADNSGGAHVFYAAATASDNVDGNLTPTCIPASGSLFDFGDTTVTCSATDSSNNTGSASFTVTVKDTTAPTLSLPANQTIEATSPSGAVATFTATASDSGGAASVTCTPASVSTFPIQATTVGCTASDGHGNSTPGQFKITVRDSVDPALNLPPDKTAEATSPSGAPVTFSVGATDLGQSVPVNCNHASGDVFPIATIPTTVTCTADDGRGNTATGSFHVTVRDTIDPVYPSGKSDDRGYDHHRSSSQFQCGRDGSRTSACDHVYPSVRLYVRHHHHDRELLN